MGSRRISSCTIAVFAIASIAIISSAERATAQAPPIPPAGSYQPIPNYTGTGAGALFRKAINDRFSGAQPVSPAIVAVTYANLPAEQDGLIVYCTDCKAVIPCAAGGAGAWATGARAGWACAPGALEAALNANGKQIKSVAADTTSGDALARGLSTLNSLAAPTGSFAMASQKLTGLGVGAAAGDSMAFGQTGAQLGAYLAPFPRSGTTECAFGDATVTCNKPLTTQIGDTILFCAEWNTGSGSINSLPTGFSQVGTAAQGNSNTMNCASRVADGTEASTFTMVWSAGTSGSGLVLDIANGAAAASIDASLGGTTGSTGSVSVPAPSTTNAGDLMLVYASAYPTAITAPTTGVRLFGSADQRGMAAYYYPGAPQTATLTSVVGAMSYFQIAVLPLSQASSKLMLKGQANDAGGLFGTNTIRAPGVTNPVTGFALNGCVNPVAKGADPTGIFDSSAAFNSSYTEACSNSVDVCVPSGTYTLIAPWLAKCASGSTNPSIFGADRRSTFLRNRIAGHGTTGGLTMELAASNVMGTSGLTAGLIGGGNAFNFGTGNQIGFNLNESMGPRPLNGVSAFTVRAVAKVASTGVVQFIAVSDGAAAFNSEGCNSGFEFNGGCKRAFLLALGSDNKVYCALKTSVTGWQMIGGSATVSAAGVYQFQLDYDGSNLRCFHGATGGANMTMDAKAAQTGTVVQNQDETTTLGYQSQQWFDLGDGNFWQGVIDSFEIAKSARCANDTCASTSAKFAGDSNSLQLDNWTSANTANLPLVMPEYSNGQQPDTTVFDGKQSWMTVHNFLVGSGTSGQNQPAIRDIAFLGGNEAIHVTGVAPQFRDVDVYGQASYGIIMDTAADYDSSISGGYFNTNYLGIDTASGLIPMYGMQMACGAVSCLIAQGPTVNSAYFLPGSSTMYPVIVGGIVTLIGDEWDVESGGTFPGLLISNINAAWQPQVTIDGAQGPTSSGAKAPVAVDMQYRTVVVRNSQLIHASSPGPFVDLSWGRAGATSNVEFDNNTYDFNAEPTDTSGDSYISATDQLGTVPRFSVVAGGNSRQTSLTGTTAGSVKWSEPVEGQFYKKVVTYLNGYENTTGTAQTITYPLPFTTVEGITTLSGNCANVTSSNTALTLPSSMGATQTGLCAVEGY